MAAVPLLLILLTALSVVLEATLGTAPTDLAGLFQRFFPAETGAGAGASFAAIAALLDRIREVGWTLTLVAAPVFVWTGLRLFAGIRTSLSWIYDVSVRPQRGHALARWLRGKGRDLVMLLVTFVLLAAHVLLSTGLVVLQAWSAAEVPGLAFFLTGAGRWLGEGLALAFLLALFMVLYRWASPRRMGRIAALIAAGFGALAFELAKNLFGWYVANVMSGAPMRLDANLGALLLFVLWMYYTALVFLLGGIVAETWEMRLMLRRQQAPLGARSTQPGATGGG